jgi:hypothetical protein
MLTAAAFAGLMLLASLIVAAATFVPTLGPGLMMVPAATTVVIRLRMMCVRMRVI